MTSSIEERFFAKVAEGENGCLIWTAYRTALGYGRIVVKGKVKYAHRVAYELFVGPVPAGLVLDHLCRNRACVNVSHLEPVTQRENCNRGETGQYNGAKMCCAKGHEFSIENTYNYRGSRHCRMCRANEKRERRARLRS